MIVQPGKHVPGKSPDAVVPYPSLVGIDHPGLAAPRPHRTAALPATELHPPKPSILVDYREGCGGYGQLRGNLRPLLQTADPCRSRKLVRHDYLISRVQANAIKLCADEKPIHITGGHYHSIRAQHECMMHVGLRFSLACYLKIRS